MTTIEKECALVASIFDNPTGRFGESLCTALAHWEWWESVEAKFMGKAITACLEMKKVPSRAFVAANLPEHLRKWPLHPMFGANNALSLELADHEAASLLPIYKNKRLIAVVGGVYQKMIDHPEEAYRMALNMKILLEDFA